MKTKNVVILISAIILLVAVYLFYSRPMTIQQRYPMLTLDKCTEISGYYKVDEQVELTEFSIDKDSKEFEALWGLLYEQDYRRALKDILPRGTRIHPTEAGDFQWEVIVHFDYSAECDCMKCPCCGNEMTSGIVQSARQIFFTTKAHKNWFIPDTAGNEEIVLSSHNWTRPTCTAYHCAECKKVVIDYSVEVE